MKHSKVLSMDQKSKPPGADEEFMLFWRRDHRPVIHNIYSISNVVVHYIWKAGQQNVWDRNIDRSMMADFVSPRDELYRGYFYAVAVALREEGGVSAGIRSMFEQGGDPMRANPMDIELFREHGLMP